MHVKEKGREINEEVMPYLTSVSSYCKFKEMPKQISWSLSIATSDLRTICKSSLQATSELCNGQTGMETVLFNFGAQDLYTL